MEQFTDSELQALQAAYEIGIELAESRGQWSEEDHVSANYLLAKIKRMRVARSRDQQAQKKAV